jgi:RND family efflux transporter MFP subunit
MTRQPVGRWRRRSALLLVLLATTGCHREVVTPAPKKPTEVLISSPVVQEVTDYEEFTGRAEAMKTVEVRARVTGYLTKILFTDGDEVEEGKELFEIDPRPYKAALDKAQGSLAQAMAREKRAQANFQRNEALYNRQTISQSEYDIAWDEYAEARAATQVAQAELEMAALNLDFTSVEAEIGGRISRRQVDVGNLVKADDTILTTIVMIDKLYVYFDIDERTLLRLRRYVQEGRMQSRRDGAEVPVLFALADDDSFKLQGLIDFSENRVDPNTGTLSIRAVIDNPKPHLLSPGLFLRVRLPIGKPREALVIDEKAIGTDQGQKFLYVLNDKDEVVTRPVKVGALNGLMRVVEEGLEPGERVVVSGLQRIRAGVKVVPKPAAEYAGARAEAGPAQAGDAAQSPRAGG